MFNGAVRLGDGVMTTCNFVPPGPFYLGSFTTFINTRPAIRLFDPAVPGIAITGSFNTFIDGRPAVRFVDRVVCGIILTASFDTFIS